MYSSINSPKSSCNREAILSSSASSSTWCFVRFLGNIPRNGCAWCFQSAKCVLTICIRLTRLVKNKLRVSLKVSTSFSASINHSFSASGSPESIPCQSSCKRWYPRMTSASFCASSSLSCGCVNLGARGCVLTLCCAFSSKREVEPKLS